MIIDKVITYISSSSPARLVFLATFSVLMGSIPLVYLASLIGGVEYTWFLLAISIFLPLILTPTLISLLIRLTTSLQHFKKHLDEEIEKNKAKDIMMFEQARFAFMGETLANISHQWKQPLNTINLSIVNLKLESRGNKNEEKYFDIIEDNVNYLGATIDDFMSFFDKRSSSEMKSLCSIIHEVQSIINKEIYLDIGFNFECSDIKIASSISQVLLNLLNNAKDALLNVDGEKKIVLSFEKEEDGLIIVVSDNGSGIKKEIREKIFSPYFTTKKRTQGTGIGLYMSKQILNKLFGAEIVLLDVTQRTSFKIKIPCSEQCVVEV